MRILSILFIIVVSSCAVSDNSDSSAAFLVSPDVVSDWMYNDSNIRCIELSSAEEYFTGHLPNAVSFQRNDYRDTLNPIGGMMAKKDNIENLLQRAGINSGDTIVLYGEHANVDACRFFWILESYGHKSAFILDGGKKAWKETYPVSVEVPNITLKGNFKFSENMEPATDNAGIESVLTAKENGVQLVDTRSIEEYLGQPFINKGKIVEWKNGASINGTIPGSIHFHWTRLQHYEAPYGFKSRKDILHEFEKSGIDPYGDIILYCQSGSRSSHTLFALKHIVGNKRVKNFDGSWIEWSAKYADNPELISQISSKEENNNILANLKKEIIDNNG